MPSPRCTMVVNPHALCYSEPACLRDPTVHSQTHAEFVSDLPEWLRSAADVMIEANAKEHAVLQQFDASA